MAAVAQPAGLGVTVVMCDGRFFGVLSASQLCLDGMGGDVVQLLRSIGRRMCMRAARQQG